MDSLTITVPVEQQGDVDAWEDGGTYTLNVKQTEPGKLELVSSSATVDEEAGEAAPAEPMEGESENPAVAMVMAAKKAK